MEDVKKEFDDVRNEFKKEGIIKTFLNFDKMITPTIIKIIFYIGLVVSIFSGISMILRGMSAYYGGGLQVFIGILVLLLSPIIVRVYCELLIIMFKIHESLIELKK